MKLIKMSLGICLASLLLVLSTTATGREPPVAKLIQINGTVEYSRNGDTWRPVRRTKYLFSGYQIKTGSDGSAKLIDQKSGMSQDLGSNSEIEITDSMVTLIMGSLSKPKQEDASIFEGLSNKFAKAQRYTTVRRGGMKSADDVVCDNKVRTIRKVTLSPSYPELVWRNACPEYSYKLVIDDVVHEISAHSNAEMIRFKVEGIDFGEHMYRVEVFDVDGTVYIPKKTSTFVFIDKKQEMGILNSMESFGDDVFLVTDLLESKDMYVAAMDLYRDYFNENPDDNDMRPLLIKSYQDLKLSNLRENEARLYNASLEEDF